ncbi:MAG: hypothetical protein LBG59_05650 [Candidatus Peribacteria bacterium]|jgi:hypothetical protein|nr:hypothetical protein [Candidatus Peribacteria bacterium]
MRALRLVNVCNTALITQEKKREEKKKAESNYKISLFDFSSATRESIKKNATLLRYVAKERIKDELTKVFTKGNPF